MWAEKKWKRTIEINYQKMREKNSRIQIKVAVELILIILVHVCACVFMCVLKGYNNIYNYLVEKWIITQYRTNK